MVYIDSKGNVLEKKASIFACITSFFGVFIAFFLSLFGLDRSNSTPNSYRDQLRNGDGGTWPGSGGPGGPGRRGDGLRRPIGRLPNSSGMSCPPMAGGG